MRMWHKDLISALPDQQLQGQWRELSTIMSNILKFKKPNSSILNKMMLAHKEDLLNYMEQVYNEGLIRNKRFDWEAIYSKYICIPTEYFSKKYSSYNFWMNDRYLRQCYYNLEEKYDCGVILNNQYYKILNVVNKAINCI